MALREIVTASTGVKVYAISGAKSVPAWERLASDSARRSLKKRDEDLQRHLELVQGLEFDAACTRLAPTRDGHYLLATGYHPPTVKCFDLDQLSLKWQRCLTSEIVSFEALDDDYSKLAFICADRTLAFHAKFGAYFSTRTPRVGRALAYLPEVAELLVGGTGSEVYRLSLSEGRFMAPIVTAGMDGVNAMDVNSVHGLLALGGEASTSSGASDGRMACYDPRTRNRVGTLGVDEEVTAVRFSPNGMQLACGTTAGIVKVFDLRSSTPLVEKDHMYDSKIVSVHFHSATAGALEDTKRSIVSSDKHAVRVWDVETGATTAAIEPPKSTINDVCMWPGSGLLLVACEHSKIQSYFIPSMGPAPRWCHFLEGLTEELEEQKNTAVYDDYRFVTRQELGALGLEHLIGTKLLRASLHGFFIDLRLYKRAKAIADPFAFETYRKQKIEAALKLQEKTRIAVRKKLPKVNAELADRLRDQAEGKQSLRDARPGRNQNDDSDDDDDEEEEEDEDNTGRAKGANDDKEGDLKDLTPAERKKRKRDRSRAAEAASILDDDRFKAMFEDERFQVDTQSNEYKVLHPNADAGTSAGGGNVDSDDDLLDEHFDEDDEDGDDLEDGEDGEDEANDWGLEADVVFGPAPTRGKKRLLIEKDDAHTAAYSKGVSLAADLEKPLGERVEDEANEERKEHKTKNIREMTFEIENPKKNKKREGRKVEGLHRRSVSALRHK